MRRCTPATLTSPSTVTQLRRLTVRESGRQAEWDSFVGSEPTGHVLQSWNWGEFKRAHGWTPVRIGVYEDARLRAAAQLLVRSAAGISLAYVPRGPVCPDSDPHLLDTMLRGIHSVARDRHSIFLKIEPNIAAGSWLEGELLSRGFLRSPHTVQARATLMIDLTGGPDAVLSRMKGKTRYNIRLAEKRGVTVRPAATAADLETFHRLMIETGKRDEFPVRSLGYYRDVLERFRPDRQAELLLAEFGGETVAAVMVFAYGAEGLYMYGASSSEHRREMPAYLLQWRAMAWCIQRGCARYDMWGIPEQVAEGTDERDELQQKNVRSGLWGVYRFKQGFGGDVVRYTGALDFPYIRPLYLAWRHLRRSKEL